ncbi:hypothetical protein DESC_930049 [Desulfosarcina cetonica]|nr:hypothetical protein DESC_930049 [Desulfosarcina cetonica]
MFHLARGNDGFSLVVDRADDDAQQDAQATGNGQPPDIPDHGESEQKGQHADEKAMGVVFRHQNVFKVIRRPVGPAVLLHVRQGIDVRHLRNHGKIVDRGRRGGGPFQGAAVPGVAGQVPVGVPVADAHPQLDALHDDAHQDQGGTARGNDQIGLPGRVPIVFHAPRHAHEPQNVKGGEGQVKTDDPAPEGALAPFLVQAKSDGLGKPVGVARKIAEHGTRNQHVVEMGNEKQAVVDHVVGRWHRHQHAGHAADDKGREKPQGPVHGGGEADAALIHGEEPVEDLHPGGNGDHHGRDAEEGIDPGRVAHGEEMMQPDGKGKNHDPRRRIDQGTITEEPLARKGGHHLRKDAEGRQDHDVDLGVAPDPEEVVPHHHVAPQAIGKKMHPQVTIQRQQEHGDSQGGKGQDHEHIGGQGGPDEQRHAHQRHSRCTQFQDDDKKIDAGQGGTDAGDLEGPGPVIHPGTRTVLGFEKRGDAGPTGG